MNVDLIKNGRVEGLLTDGLTSRLWCVKNTGNGRSSSFEQPVIPRMRNTYLHNGKYSYSNIISETKNGICAIDIGGAQTDISTGDFVIQILSGYLIRNGIPVALVKPFLYKGNVLDIFSKIDMIGNDLKLQIATCGKKGQTIYVSYGQPTIRISDQMIG